MDKYYLEHLILSGWQLVSGGWLAFIA